MSTSPSIPDTPETGCLCSLDPSSQEKQSDWPSLGHVSTLIHSIIREWSHVAQRWLSELTHWAGELILRKRAGVSGLHTPKHTYQIIVYFFKDIIPLFIHSMTIS